MPEQTAIIEKRSILCENTTEIILKTKTPFNFTAGQYVTITLPTLQSLSPKDQSRDFSIASPPEDVNHITIAFRDSESVYKKELLRPDYFGEVTIDGPKGILVLPETYSIPIVFIAGGIAISPFLSIIQHVISQKLPYNINVLYYNHKKETTAYLEELNELTKNQLNIKIDFKFKRITDEDLHIYPQDSLWYVAGSRGMVKLARVMLSGMHINERFIKTEEYAGYA